MKVRINGNSIRVRLSSELVDELKSEGKITGQTNFPNDECLTFSIVMKDDYGCTFEGDKVTIYLPKHDTLAWADSDNVSLSSKVATGNNAELSILVEKDLIS